MSVEQNEIGPLHCISPGPDVLSAARGDQTFVRKRQRAVFAGQAAMAVLVTFAVTAYTVVVWSRVSAVQLLLLSTAAIGLIVWSIWGTRRIHQYFQLGYRADQVPLELLGNSGWHAVVFFGVQFSFILVIYAIAIELSELRFLWLVLLPSVGHAVLFLSPSGAAVVALSIIGILTYSIVQVYDWAILPGALMQFSQALAFTFVFAYIAVSAERGRAEVALLANQLSAMNRQLGEYAVQAEELAASRERNQLARDIHDSVGHVLTAVNIQLRAAQAMLSQDPASAAAAIAKAQALTRDGLADIRSSVAALRTSPLENRSLEVAIAEIVEANQETDFAAALDVCGVARPLTPAADLALYRAVQEGVTNARKHSRATRVAIVLDYRAADTVRLSLTDDGGGADALSGGFGLVGLRERAELLGGALAVSTVPGQGVQLEMRLPG